MALKSINRGSKVMGNLVVLENVKAFIKRIPIIGVLARRVYWFIGVEYWFIRVQRPLTKLLGTYYTRSKNEIELDITYRCNLKCMNCNRSCAQAPSEEQMTVGQIIKFVEESIRKNIKWSAIRVVGGEPVLHPNVIEILCVLLEYKHKYSPDTQIGILTNGFGDAVNTILSKIPQGIGIANSKKTSSYQGFFPFNIAPKDEFAYRFVNFSNGCWALRKCGLGLTPLGYYPCPQGGGIDRVFGFDIGRKELPDHDDSMEDQLKVLCRLCGHFMLYKRPVYYKQIMSATWEKAYEKYKLKNPILSRY